MLAYWALQTIGGVAAPGSFGLRAVELRYVLEDSGARVALFEADTAETMLEAADGWPGRLVFAGAGTPGGVRSLADVMAAGVDAPARAFPVAESDLSLLLYTSGTTGRPKGVPRTHRNHHAGRAGPCRFSAGTSWASARSASCRSTTRWAFIR